MALTQQDSNAPQKRSKLKPWISWLLVLLWTLVIYATIPMARSIGSFVEEHWGRALFTYAVLTAIITTLGLAILGLRLVHRRKVAFGNRLVWLIATAAVYIGYALYLGRRSPEESVHFIQYGVLGALLFRALTFKQRDATVFLSAAVICGIIGTVDEIIQWLVPGRHWDLRDIWINFFSAALIQVAIAKGVKPPFIDIRFGRDGIRRLCLQLIVLVAILGASFLNTPDRIAWYAKHIPGLAFLAQTESVMLEYGYCYDDPQIGIFRSRLAPEELSRTDRQRAAEAAAILNRYRKRTDYQTFLSKYTPISDPFVHEARVHLFSRDVNFSRALDKRALGENFGNNLSDAYRENQILEKYFPHTLALSDHQWSEGKKHLARKYLRLDKTFESFVSRHLVTGIGELQVMASFALLILGLLVTNHYLKVRSAPKTKRPDIAN